MIPGNPSASTSCAITPVSSVIPAKLSGVVADDFHVNVLPLIALILSNAFGITVMFSLRFISDALNAIISSPTCSFPSIPTPPCTINAPESLFVDAVVPDTSKLVVT